MKILDDRDFHLGHLHRSGLIEQRRAGRSLAESVGDLALCYRDSPEHLPAGWQRGDGEVARLRGIGDYIAGMTDRFAIARHEALVGPVELPDRF